MTNIMQLLNMMGKKKNHANDINICDKTRMQN